MKSVYERLNRYAGGAWGSGGSSSTGDVAGPASATDNALARFDGTGGKTLQNSVVIIDDSGNMTGVASVVINNTGLKVKDTNASHNLSIVPGSDLTADRTLTLTTGDASLNVNMSFLDFTSSGQTQINGKSRARVASWPINQQTTSATLNTQDFYMLSTAIGSFTCTKARIYVNAVGGDPTNLDLKVLNAAGNSVLGSLSGTVLISAGGYLDLTFSSSFSIVDGTDYWIGIAGDASNSSFAATTASLNNIAWNRFAGNSTVQSTIPAGTTTATRFCIELLP